MAGSIGIEWLYGHPLNNAEDDEERAEAAALASLERANVTPNEAHAAYKAQWLEFDDEGQMHGAALAWIAAREAADMAATKGWDKPDGAAVSIYL